MIKKNNKVQPKPTRNVDVHYRRLDRERAKFPDDITFAEALRRALRRQHDGVRLQDDVARRVQDTIPGKSGDIRCWNNINAAHGAIFGTLCLYRPTELQAVIQARNIRDQVDAFPLDQVGDTNGRDFLRAIAYWMAIEDHFYLIQSPSLQTGAVENYFSWLLTAVRILDEEQSVLMSVALDSEAVGGDLDDLTSVNFGGTVELPASEDAGGGQAKHGVGAVDIRPDLEGEVQRRRVGKRPVIGNGWDLLHQVIHDHRSLEEIENAYRDLCAQDPNATLDAELEFYVRIRRHRDENSKAAKQRALRAITSGLRDMPDGSVTAKGKDGIVNGQEIRLKMPRLINLAPAPKGAERDARSALLDLDHAFQEMHIVHKRLTEDGKI